jgi:N-acetylglucosamine-6-phosphate deacetylase
VPSTYAVRAGRTLVAGVLEPDVTVVVEDGRIADVLRGPAPAADVVLERPDGVLAPGFVDLHVHALDGAGVLDPSSVDAVGLGAALVRRGVTGFLATTIAGPLAEIADVLRRMPGPDDIVGARFLGVHLEGPWLSPVRPGAQPLDGMALPDAADLDRLAAIAPVALVTLAPELPGGLELVRGVRRHGAVAAIGHSDATYDEVLAAVEAGATHVTHAFNAMSPLHHRAPGVAGAALDVPGLTVEAIADGVHLHPAAVRILWRARGATGVCLVSDAVDLGVAPSLEGGVRRPDGVLAGSTTGLDAAVRNAVAWGIPLADALTMAATTPASVLGRADLGGIAPGATADLVLLDRDLAVDTVVVGGDHAARSAA